MISCNLTPSSLRRLPNVDDSIPKVFFDYVILILTNRRTSINLDLTHARPISRSILLGVFHLQHQLRTYQNKTVLRRKTLVSLRVREATMSNYHDQRGTDRYAPPPRQRDTSSLSRPPPSGPSHQYSGPSVAPPPSIGPPRHPSSNYPSRPYDSVPRGPRLDSTPLHPRAYEPPPPRRTSLSLWSTQNPGGRDGYHHSGQPQGQARSYVQSAYRDYDRDPYDRDRDYRAPLRYP